MQYLFFNFFTPSMGFIITARCPSPRCQRFSASILLCLSILTRSLGFQQQQRMRLRLSISRRAWWSSGAAAPFVLASSSSAVAAAAAAAVAPQSVAATPRQRVEYVSVDLSLAGQRIPMSVWSPASTTTTTSSSSSSSSSSAAAVAASYRYRISVSKIVKLLLGLKLPFDVAREFTIPRPPGLVVARDTTRQQQQQEQEPSSSSSPPLRRLPTIVFCHGYLGSRLDFCHVCERLAGEGFLVAAPELPESLSASFDPNPNAAVGLPPSGLLSRPAIVAAALDRLRWRPGGVEGSSSSSSSSSDGGGAGEEGAIVFDADPSLAGIIGHSAGGGTASSEVSRCSSSRSSSSVVVFINNKERRNEGMKERRNEGMSPAGDDLASAIFNIPRYRINERPTDGPTD